MAEKFKKRSGLGRGLGALLEDTGEKKKISGSGATPKGAINEIAIASIETNPWQPRTEFDENDAGRRLRRAVARARARRVRRRAAGAQGAR